MEESKISNMSAFEKQSKKELGLNIREYKEFVRNQLKKEEVSRLNVFIPRPSEQEIKKWYSKNKTQIGKFYKYRLIRKGFSANNYKSELNANAKMKKARDLAQKNFARAAALYSDHPSKKNGGLMPYARIDEIVREDIEIAIALQNTQNRKISPVSRHPNKNYYFFVKVEESKAISYEEAKPLIERILYVKKKMLSLKDG